VGLVVLIAWKRWHETAVNEFSEQVLQLTRDEGTAGRIGLEGKSEALGQLGSAVNKRIASESCSPIRASWRCST
jgi:hypothetical protein